MSPSSIRVRGLAVRSILIVSAALACTTQVQAQQPTYYYPAAPAGQQPYYYPQQTATYPAPAYATQYYQAPTAPQYYQVAQLAQTADTVQYQQTSYTVPVAEAPAVQPTQASPAATYGSDPYGFLSWLNSVRASYGLGAVGYDANLSSWASQNNSQQMARGLGHFVMGPARRQNSAMGAAFPGAMWMASPAHRAALLDPTISWIGIAAAGAYWTFNAY